MLKKIKILKSFIHKDEHDMEGEIVDALVLKDPENGNLQAAFDSGWPYHTGLQNWDNDLWFEVVADIGGNADEANKLRKELQDESKKLVAAYETIEEYKEDLKSVEAELKELKEKGIKREHIKDGYVIMPCMALDEELAKEVASSEEVIITAKELVAMNASAQLEINKGDVRPASLNVKLYNAINDFAQEELEKMIDQGKEK